MPKLPAVKPRQIIRFLERNGFISDHTSGSHVVFYNPVPRRRAGASASSRHAEGNSDVVAARSGIHAGRVDRLPGREGTLGVRRSAPVCKRGIWAWIGGQTASQIHAGKADPNPASLDLGSQFLPCHFEKNVITPVTFLGHSSASTWQQAVPCSRQPSWTIGKST